MTGDDEITGFDACLMVMAVAITLLMVVLVAAMLGAVGAWMVVG